jgi:four helix bundle protein
MLTPEELTMQDFRNLKVWEKSHQLVLAVYRATAGFPREELYGLTNQVRRCAVSVPSNVAEGCGRGTDADFRRFLQMAVGSASEMDYQLLLARDLGYLPADQQAALAGSIAEVKRMLAALMQRLS